MRDNLSLRSGLSIEGWEYYEIVRKGSAMLSLNKFRGDNFRNLLKESGYKNIVEEEISDNAEKSLERLYRYARIPYFFIKPLGLQNRFINTTAAVEYYKLAKKGLLRYFVYTASK